MIRARQPSWGTAHRIVRPLVALVAVAALTGGASAQLVHFCALIDGAQETPPNASPAKGTAVLVMDRQANTLSYTILIQGLSSAETLAHIHGYAGPGAPAGIKHSLPLGSFKTGVWSYPAAEEQQILDGLTYINIHTTMFSGGEIRGQILRSNADVTMFAVADGAQEVPPTPSTAKGVGCFKIDTVANTVSYQFTMTGLSSAETLAHIHGYAPPGTPAGVKHNLPLGNHKVGTWAYPAADEASILAGLAYVNIHTSMFSGGEIRGQIVPGCTNPMTYCTGKVNSLGCTPAIGWTGTPSLGGADDFHITCTDVISDRSGLLFWGIAPNNAPFQGGIMCVQTPVNRTPIQNSGGTPGGGDCLGMYDFHFSHADLTTFGLGGKLVYAEYWYRDPQVPSTTGLSNAIQFDVQ
jgi:hypothetical protein